VRPDINTIDETLRGCRYKNRFPSSRSTLTVETSIRLISRRIFSTTAGDELALLLVDLNGAKAMPPVVERGSRGDHGRSDHQ
jgi:hypothetical protein